MHGSDARRLSPRAAALVALVLALTSALTGLVPAPGGSVRAPSADGAAYQDWGRARAADQPLHRGCHRYRYRYRVTPPSGNAGWLAEIYLSAPDGTRLGNHVWNSDSDPARARRSFEICRQVTRYGRHKLSMRVTWFEDDLDRTAHAAWVRPTYFRLYRP
jgi:hypothetical protein